MPIFKTKKTEEKKSETKEKAKKKDATKQSMKDLYGSDKKTKKTSTKSTEKKAEPKAVARGNAYKVLVKPLITEKAAALSSSNKYVFEVSRDSNKIEVADAVMEVYGERPISVNMVSVKGKKVRHGRTIGKRRDWKKAIVTLEEGKTINIYEGV